MKKILIIVFLFFQCTPASAVTLRADKVETNESVVSKEQATKPVNPASGKQKLYFKTDGNLYKLDSAGTERRVDDGGNVATFAPLPTLNSTLR